MDFIDKITINFSKKEEIMGKNKKSKKRSLYDLIIKNAGIRFEKVNLQDDPEWNNLNSESWIKY